MLINEEFLIVELTIDYEHGQVLMLDFKRFVIIDFRYLTYTRYVRTKYSVKMGC
jgi:hypothetical protein